MDGTCVFGHCSADGLANPPGGVGAETEAACGVKLLGGAYEPEIALLNKVEQEHAMVVVAFRDADHETKVGLDQALLCLHIS